MNLQKEKFKAVTEMPALTRLQVTDEVLQMASAFALSVYKSLDRPELISVKAAKAKYGAGLIDFWEKTEGLQRVPLGEKGVQFGFNIHVLDALMCRSNMRALMLQINE